jgi:hypothetical protein
MDKNRWIKPVKKNDIYKTVMDNAFDIPNHQIDLLAVAIQLDNFDPDNPQTWKHITQPSMPDLLRVSSRRPSKISM